MSQRNRIELTTGDAAIAAEPCERAIRAADPHQRRLVLARIDALLAARRARAAALRDAELQT